MKLAAFVAVAGIDTAELPGASQEFTDILTALKADQDQFVKSPGAGLDVGKSFSAAVEKVRALVQKNDKDAVYALARWGVLGGSDINEVAALYRRAAGAGQILAKTELSLLLTQTGAKNPKKVKESIKLIQEAEAADEKIARRMLAQLYLQGVTEGNKGKVVVEKSSAKAMALLEKGEKAGDGRATLGLAQIYSVGIEGIPQDHSKALTYLVKACNQGNGEALNTFSRRLLHGDPDTPESPKLLAKDVPAVLEMLNQAAEKGLAPANLMLGQIYEQGMGADVKRDVPKAFDCYSKAACGNDAESLFRLGNACETGILKAPGDKANILIQPDAKRALNFYRLAAANGMQEAYFNLGVFYETGIAVDKDLAKAREFFSRAVLGGVAQAQKRLDALK
ncbi:tetratricopeptide repeat protein [Prosthecobacter sp.]|uniref:tetratricopeptide repeat protein n=1 Tax=Prosthecobacter sp. TaxID=1965333 RepID=UPI003BB07AAF